MPLANVPATDLPRVRAKEKPEQGFTNLSVQLIKCSMNVLAWLQQDLRLPNNPALAVAAGMGAVLPVYIAEPEAWVRPEASARQWGFVADCLAELRGEMATVGLTLALRSGPAVEVLSRLCLRHDIRQIVSHTGAADPWVQARNAQVAAWAEAVGVAWVEVSEAVDMPLLRGVKGVEPGPVPHSRSLKLADDRCPHRQKGGRAEGLRLLESFLVCRGEAYAHERSALLAERASSRLSPHLAQGTLSRAEILQAVAERLASRPGPAWTRSLRLFQARLMMAETGAGVPLAAAMPPDARLRAWQAGETGVPFLDAVMRYLAATGWLAAPLRGMVAAAAIHLLELDPDMVGQALARAFTDYAPDRHWPAILAIAQGNAGAVRNLNPVKAAAEFDPTGAFTRRWLPELASLPDQYLQEPWKWKHFQSVAGHRYPESLIDCASAERAARARIRALRLSRPQPTDAAQKPVKRGPQSPVAQLWLDL